MEKNITICCRKSILTLKTDLTTALPQACTWYEDVESKAEMPVFSKSAREDL